MTSTIRRATLALASLLASPTAVAQVPLPPAGVGPPPAPEAARPYQLGQGLRTALGPVDVRLRGRVHADLVEPFLDDFEDALGTDLDAQTEVRRARALLDLRGSPGTGFEHWRLRAQVGFRGSTVRWFDLHAGIDGLLDTGPIEESHVRAGEFREPFGLEAMTSVAHLPFIERSTPTSAFSPGRSRGAQVAARTSNALFQLGVFRASEGRPFPDELLDERAVTARALWQPAGPGWVQLGGSVSVRDPRGGALVFRARTGSSLLERFADTGPIEADSATIAGLEALWSRGRWTAQSEWFGSWIDGATGASEAAFLHGGYASVAAFLGDGRSTWSRMRGAIAAPDVFGSRGDGRGSFEAVARVSWTDLVDGAVDGGRILDAEAGLNWYLTPTTRVMLHWLGVRGDIEGTGAELGSAILGRVQIQF